MSTRKATMAENKYGERVIKIEFPFNYEDLDRIRSLPGRSWHSDQKVWSAPVHHESLRQLLSWGFVLDERLQAYLQKIDNHQQKIIQSIGIPGLKGKPYPYQTEGTAFIDAHGGRALIADDMGLGKSLEALSYVQLHRDKVPVVVVCPSSLKYNWERECNLWLPDPSTEILKGTVPWKPTGQILIVNYDVVPAWVETLKKLKPEILILDEAHFIKNSKAKRTKAVKLLSKGVPHVIGLTGTPIENRPVEIYNAVSIIDHVVFPNQWYFLNRYCAPKFNGFGWNYNGASNTKELHDILSKSIMIRRKKEEVLKDLPPKIKSFVPFALDNSKEYNEAEKNFIQWVQKTRGAQAALKASNAESFAQIEGLKQLAVKGKLSQSIEWIKDFFESQEKLVVFATHKFVIDSLMEAFGEIAVKVDGSVVNKERQNAVDRFMTDPGIKLFVGNIKAAGVGLTLTASSSVAFLEYPWTPGALEQASDRVHRIGQKDTVNIYYLISRYTIEEKMVEILDSKSKVISTILDGKEIEEESLLTELLKQYT